MKNNYFNAHFCLYPILIHQAETPKLNFRDNTQKYNEKNKLIWKMCILAISEFSSKETCSLKTLQHEKCSLYVMKSFF